MQIKLFQIVGRVSLLGLLLGFGLAFGGCASSEWANDQEKYESEYSLNVIVKGQTLEEEVIQMLGNPNSMAPKEGVGVLWVYKNQVVDSNSKNSLILLGGEDQFFSSLSSRFDLFLTFNGANVVQDYFIIASHGGS